MAATVSKNVGVSDESSSSDDEELKRCQEAVWETKAVRTKDGECAAIQSKRVVVADHEHDGNELQVTPGFRTHVAKKLVHFLDSCISEIQSETSSHLKSTNCEGDDDNDDDDDEGFRLFSTSVPGQIAEEPPAPVRRRPIPSSSDSDSEMEMRLKEAAVCVKDLLPSSACPSTCLPSSAESPILERRKKKKIISEEEEGHVVKKKKKRKQNKEESEQVDSTYPANQSDGEHGNSDQEHTEVKLKRKKKKKRKGNVEEND